MELPEAIDKVRDYVRHKFEVPDGDPDFNDNVHLFDYGYVDSFGAVDLISFVEKAFGIKITHSDLIAYPLNTVREIAGFALHRSQGEL